MPKFLISEQYIDPLSGDKLRDANLTTTAKGVRQLLNEYQQLFGPCRSEEKNTYFFLTNDLIFVKIQIMEI